VKRCGTGMRGQHAAPAIVYGRAEGKRRACVVAVALLLTFAAPRVDASGTICSRQPSACDGTFTGSTLLLGAHGAEPTFYDISGTVPSEVGLLTQITHLYLNYNSISGTIPSQLGLTQITDLQLQQNSLSGTMPSEILMLSHITILGLDQNSLSGTVPSQLGLLSQITDLGLGKNSLSGSVPSEVGLLTKITWLWLSANFLSGTLPSELAQLNSSQKCFLTTTQCLAVFEQYSSCGASANTNAFDCPLPSLSAACAAHLGVACPPSPPLPSLPPPAPSPSSPSSFAGDLAANVGVTVLSVGIIAIVALAVWAQRRRRRADPRLVNEHSSEIELDSMKVVVSTASALGEATSSSVSAVSQSLAAELRRIVAALPDDQRIGGRFDADASQLMFGAAEESVLPIAQFMCVNVGQVVRLAMAEDNGLAAIEAEITAHGTDEDKECFQYVRYGKTGDNTKIWANGILDEGREPGLPLEWFHEQAPKEAGLTIGMVLALRLYTTACYKSINNPLRGLNADYQPRPLSPEQPHPLPVTVHLLTEGVKQLRAVEGATAGGRQKVTLWRGLRNVGIADAFLEAGGSEKAPMSATSNLEVAVRYSASACSVLLKLETSSFRERGADLSFLSAFPGEREVLYPPLTHLAPTRTQRVTTDDGGVFTVIEARPTFG